MRCSCAFFSSPFQYAPAIDSSLNALIFLVDGTCGPRQKSMKCGPSVYSENTSPARSVISSHLHGLIARTASGLPALGVYLRS